jgi:hypothetical protein
MGDLPRHQNPDKEAKARCSVDRPTSVANLKQVDSNQPDVIEWNYGKPLITVDYAPSLPGAIDELTLLNMVKLDSTRIDREVRGKAFAQQLEGVVALIDDQPKRATVAGCRSAGRSLGLAGERG